MATNFKGLLFSDGSRESKKAEKLLRSNGVVIKKLKISNHDVIDHGFKAPELQTGEGKFKGLEEIEGYVSLVVNKTNGNGLIRE